MPTAVFLPPHNMPRALKWAPPQHQHHGVTQTVYAGRVKKRSSPDLRPVGKHILEDAVVNDDAGNNELISKLESEIAFTHETLSTIIVMFDSLRHAYFGSKYEMDMSRCETRLSEKEKELLSAYDDLRHQVIHLERQIKKLESKLADLKSTHQQQQQQQQPQPQPQPQHQQQQDTALSPVTPYDEDLCSSYNFLIDQKQSVIDPFPLSNELVINAPSVFYQDLPTLPFVGTAPSLLPVVPIPTPPFLYDIDTLLLMDMLYQGPSPWWSSEQQQHY